MNGSPESGLDEVEDAVGELGGNWKDYLFARVLAPVFARVSNWKGHLYKEFKFCGL